MNSEPRDKPRSVRARVYVSSHVQVEECYQIHYEPCFIEPHTA